MESLLRPLRIAHDQNSERVRTHHNRCCGRLLCPVFATPDTAASCFTFGRPREPRTKRTRVEGARLPVDRTGWKPAQPHWPDHGPTLCPGCQVRKRRPGLSRQNSGGLSTLRSKVSGQASLDGLYFKRRFLDQYLRNISGVRCTGVRRLPSKTALELKLM